MTAASGVAHHVAPAPACRWLAVRVWPSRELHSLASRRAALVDALVALGASGVHEDGTMLVTFFPEGQVGPAVLSHAVLGADPEARFETTMEEDANWALRWQEHLQAHVVGPFTIVPPWLAADGASASTIVIEPGMAFGTGEHESTRGALRLLSTVVRPGDVVTDLGSGSGVLSIAAAKRGASRVAAIEIDPEAIGNAQANVERNGVGDRVCVLEGDAAAILPLLAPVRVVLANIISTVIVELLPLVADALSDDGQAVFSGILADERASMAHVLTATGWRIEGEDSEGRWWSSIVARQ